MTEDLKLVVITGLSGAGKSQALQNFEDLGYFCIDNLPPELILKFVELCRQSQEKILRAAVVCDLRGGEFFASLNQTLSDLEDRGVKFELLFLEAVDEAMINRYKETRRRHPVSPSGNVLDGIRLERGLLTELRGKADKIIDTSDFSTADMREEIKELFGKDSDSSQMTVSVMSFGFKYGLPLDVDNVLDVRFLPNPYYIKELKLLNGMDEKVRDFVLANPVTEAFLARYFELMTFTLPHYKNEGKQHFAIAIGCTGGQHRSVAVAQKVKEYLQSQGYLCTLKHRDVQ